MSSGAAPDVGSSYVMDTDVRKTLLRLGTGYALAWSTTSMVAGPGSAALVALTGNLSHAGLFMALFFVSAATGAFSGGRAMDRFGRKPPLVTAYCCSAAGFVVNGIAVGSGSLPLFVLGTAIFAASFGAINLTRVSAAEMFPASQRGKGVAWIQISAIFGAILGPLLLLLSEPLGHLLGRAPLTLVWFIAPPLLVAAALTVAGATEPRTIAERFAAGAPGVAPESVPAENARLVPAAIISLAASQAAMSAIMGVTGAAISHAGHGVNVLGGLMLMHFIGMFGLSRIVGSIADRAGRRVTVLTGLSLLAMGGTTVALIPTPLGLGIGLMLVGFGWSFGFIGATVLLTDITPPAQRARMMGRADLVGQLSSAVVAVAGGWWFASHGLAGLGVVAIAVACLPVVLIAFIRESAPGRYTQASATG